VVNSVASKVRPGGWLLLGHSEALLRVPPGFQQVWPTVYRRD
jgi:chemotaxis methyl-accepting protein methylase